MANRSTANENIAWMFIFRFAKQGSKQVITCIWETLPAHHPDKIQNSCDIDIAVDLRTLCLCSFIVLLVHVTVNI